MMGFHFKHPKFLKEKLHFKTRPIPKDTDIVLKIYMYTKKQKQTNRLQPFVKFISMHFFLEHSLKEQNSNAALGFGKTQPSQQTNTGSPSLVKLLLVPRIFVSSICLDAVQ